MGVENIYISEVDISHRKKFAQFFTPKHIADIMSDWVLTNSDAKSILEPAMGLGVFSRILLEKNKDLSITGFDIDELILLRARDYFENTEAVTIKSEDYIFSDWDKKYDGIICNPPYFKFQDYENRIVLEEIESKLGFKFSGFTNIYSYFLVKSAKQLKKGGRAAYIVPSEFMNSDYGKRIKMFLLKTRTLRHIFVIDYKENVFDDAMTTASIILLANDDNNSELHFSNIKSKLELDLINNYIRSYPNAQGDSSYCQKDIDPNKKWRSYYQPQSALKYNKLVSFSTYARVVRGIATGANEYFCFSKSKAEEFNIHNSNLLPCICKSKDVKGSFFTRRDFDELVKKNKLAYLFDGQQNNNNESNSYINKGEQEGFDKRYLTRSRNPWYALENRPPAPIWVSVFNRRGIKFIRNEANIHNLTTFHCIYPVEPNLFETTIHIDLLFAYLLTNVAKEIFNDNRREYGNGLKKFEPNDLNNSMMLDLSLISEVKQKAIMELYNKYRLSQEYIYIDEIDSILRIEFSNNEYQVSSKLAQ